MPSAASALPRPPPPAGSRRTTPAHTIPRARRGNRPRRSRPGAPGWNPLNNAWEYDPASDEWKELAPMPTRRGAAAAGVAGGKIYVTGGANSLSGVTENGIHPARPHNVVATVEQYDPATNTWK